MLRVAYASRVKRCHSQLRVQLFALATRAVIYAKELRARRGAVPRYPWRTHTLSNHIFGENDAPRLSFAARGNLTEMRGHRRGQRSLETHQTVSTVPRAGANGHGYMTKPKSRQAEAFEANGWPNQVAERAAASFVHSIATAPPPYQTAPPPYAIDAVP